jgi:hypothetical protein
MFPKRDEAGAEGSSGSAAGATTKPAEPTAAPAQSQAPAATTPQQTPDGFVPIESLHAVTAERDSLKRATEEAERKTAEEQGRWQELAEKNDAKAKEAQAKFESTARRAAFVSAISGKASDPMAAYKLALADGLLNDVKVDEDGNAEDDPITKAIDATLKKYPMLKAGAGSFGGERGGTQSETTGFDPKKATSREMLEEGIRRGDGRIGATR